MQGKKFYIFAILIIIFCIGYPLYMDGIDKQDKSVLAKEETVLADECVFPSPNKTTYQMGLYLDINHRIMYGSTLLLTENTSGEILKELWFTTYPNAFRHDNDSPAPKSAYYDGFDDGWLEFSEIKVNGREVTYNLERISAQVELNQAIQLNEPIEVEMKWMAKIPKLAYRYGIKDNVFMLGNFYPSLNIFADGWLNSFNSPFGDPFFLQTANYLVRLNTPEAYEVVSTGVNLQKIAEDNGRETHIIEANNVRDFSLAILHDFEEINRASGQTTVKLYTPRSSNNKGAESILDDAAHMLNYFSCKFASYPYEEFKIVFVPMQGFQGMEYAGLIFLKDEFLRPNYKKTNYSFILAHEIAHQWWYGMVGSDQIREPWLDEGLANWSAYKYFQEMDGLSNRVSDPQRRVNLAIGLKDIYSTSEYYQIVYSGGENFWFDLEKRLGTEQVFKILRSYLHEYKYETATTEDLFQIIRQETPDNMDEFLDLWFKP